MSGIVQPPRRVGRSAPPLDQPMMDTKLLLLARSYRMVYDGFGSYLAARLAPSRPMFHAMLLGFIGLAIAVAGAIAMRGFAPDWYPWTLAATVLPTAWIGGWLYVRSKT
jgi:hypothetical protein